MICLTNARDWSSIMEERGNFLVGVAAVKRGCWIDCDCQHWDQGSVDASILKIYFVPPSCDECCRLGDLLARPVIGDRDLPDVRILSRFFSTETSKCWVDNTFLFARPTIPTEDASGRVGDSAAASMPEPRCAGLKILLRMRSHRSLAASTKPMGRPGGIAVSRFLNILLFILQIANTFLRKPHNCCVCNFFGGAWMLAFVKDYFLFD